MLSDQEQTRATTWVMGFTILMIWLMQVMGFTMPKTSAASSWEVLDLVKLGILSIACLGGCYTLWRANSLPVFWRVMTPLIPFACYIAYAIISVLWSPLKSVTIAQSGGLASMFFLSIAVGIVSRDRASVSTILRHLNWALLAASLFTLIAYLIDPTASGLNRDRIHSGGDGIIHPTAAGATASLGMLLPILCHFVGKLRWAKSTFLPCFLIHGCILFLSNSRTATIMAAVTIGIVILWYSTNVQRFRIVALGGLVVVGLMLIDPSFKHASKSVDAGMEYITRGQSSDQLIGVSGRAEMWSAIWGEYQKALVFGHGYFVTSEKGELLVWNNSVNYTAHNLVLQILVTTGAVGLMIFLLAMFQILVTLFDLRLGDVVQKRIFVILAISGLWYLGWAQLGVSFMGPVRPESIYFFTLIGIGLGQASLLNTKSLAAKMSPKH